MSIKVCIDNRKCCDGEEPRHAWIELPKKRDEIIGFLEANRLCGEAREEICISDVDDAPFGLQSLFSERARLFDLNLLAALLDDFDERDDAEALEAVDAYIEAYKEPKTILELMNLVTQWDEIPFYLYDALGDTPEESMGLTMTGSNAGWGFPDQGIEGYFDYEEYGRSFEDSYTLLENGYFGFCEGMPRLDRYDLSDFESEYLEYRGFDDEDDEEEA